jgi:hypothetical protein
MVAAMSEHLSILDTAQSPQTHLYLDLLVMLCTTPLQPLLELVYFLHRVASLVPRRSTHLVRLARSSTSRMTNGDE